MHIYQCLKYYTGCAKKKKDILNIYVKSQIINIFFENKAVNSQLYLWPNVKISSLYLKYSLNNNSVNFAKIFRL